MPSKTYTREECQTAMDLVEEHGGVKQASDNLGIPRGQVRHRYDRALRLGLTPSRKAPPKETSGPGKRVLVIPDMHCPFQHLDTVEFLTAAKRKFNPDRVVCLGDETDQHALSQHDPDPAGYSVGHEHIAAIDALQPIYELFPVMSVCTSNHGERIFKRAYRANIPKTFLKDYVEFMSSPPGWHWQHKFEIDGVIYEHGEGVSGQLGAMKRALSNGFKSTVIGHLHADAGVLWQSSGDRQIFAMNAGCLIDPTAYAFAYGKHSARKPMIGIGVVDRGQPTFIAMPLDAKGRWTGNL